MMFVSSDSDYHPACECSQVNCHQLQKKYTAIVTECFGNGYTSHFTVIVPSSKKPVAPERLVSDRHFYVH